MNPIKRSNIWLISSGFCFFLEPLPLSFSSLVISPVSVWDLYGRTAMLIGRDVGENDVDVNLDNTVYAGMIDVEHAVLNYTAGSWYVEDLNSRNERWSLRTARMRYPSAVRPKDYYGILGVAKTATADQIKKAYRRLAKENHPDLHPGDRQAEARFKEINEAYSVLGEESTLFSLSFFCLSISVKVPVPSTSPKCS